MPDKNDDLAACARAMIRRHGTIAQNVAEMFADAHARNGNGEMAAFWDAVTQAIRKIDAAAH